MAGAVLLEGDDPHWTDEIPKGLQLPNNQAEAGCSKTSQVLEDLHQCRDTPDRLQPNKELEDELEASSSGGRQVGSKEQQKETIQ